MDQDLTKEISVSYSVSGAVSNYMAVPYRCTLRNVLAALQGDPGDSGANEITVKDSAGDTLGVVAFGDDVAAGDTGTFTPDSTNGNKVLEKGSVIEIETATATAAADAHLSVEFDPYGRKA
jgi:hypothetical protein